jgi:hypothetical protein
VRGLARWTDTEVCAGDRFVPGPGSAMEPQERVRWGRGVAERGSGGPSGQNLDHGVRALSTWRRRHQHRAPASHYGVFCSIAPLYRERVQGRLRQLLRGRPVVMCGRICGRDRRRRDQVRELRLHHARTGPAPAEHMVGAASRAGSKTSTCSAPTTVAFLINDVLVIVNLAPEPVALVHTCRASDHDSNTASQAPGWQKGVSD